MKKRNIMSRTKDTMECIESLNISLAVIADCMSDKKLCAADQSERSGITYGY